MPNKNTNVPGFLNHNRPSPRLAGEGVIDLFDGRALQLMLL